MQFVRAAYPPVGPEKGSLLYPHYLSTPIGYGSPLVPAVADDGFPPGLAPRPACQRDSDLLQNYLYDNQHPADCKTKKLLVRRHAPGYGLFAGLGFSSNMVFLSAILGRTLIDLSKNSYFAGACPSEGADCVFQPLSSCTAQDFEESEVCYEPSCWETARVISIDRARKTDFMPCAPTEWPKERCNKDGGPKIHRALRDILPQLGPHGEQWLQQEMSRYLTRPNPTLAAFVERQMQKLQLGPDLIGVHIRHGDKNEGIQYPIRAYGLVLRRAIQVTGIKTVLVGSDNPAAFAELPRWVDLPGVRYTELDFGDNPIVFSAAQAQRLGKKHSIGLHLAAQTVMFVQARAYIGTRSSNQGQLVFAMQGNDCAQQKLDFDMGGDMFYNSWYCRGDIQHAGREWMCSLKKPAEPNNYLWEWGGARTQC